MSLQGSIETFALPDVLGLLAITKKSGELHVVAETVDGRVWVAGGQLVQSVVGGRDLKAVDAVFELLRLTSGTFSFAADQKPPKPGPPEAVDQVLAAAQTALAEWQDISKVVPDIKALVTMATEPPGDQITVAAEQWKLLVALGGGRSVAELMAVRGSGEFETCKAVKALLDARLVTLGAAAPSRAPAAPASPAAPAPSAGSSAGASTAPTGAKSRLASAQAKAADVPARGDGRQQGDRSGDTADDGRPARSGWSVATPATRAPATEGSRTDRAGAEPAPEPTPAPTAAKNGASAPSAADAQVLVAQLAALAGDDEEVVAEKVAAHLAEGGELPSVADANEPINRGLLLKFLSSVRN